MDKLLKICRLFGCSLDDLVTGDLTGRAPADVPAPVVPAGPPTDVCGYDEHQRMLARKVPLGAALCVAAVVPVVIADGLGLQPAGVALLFLFIVAALALLVPAGMEHSAFVKAHPYVEDFYTEKDRAPARRQLAYGVVGGVGSIFVGVMGPVLTEGTGAEDAWAVAWLLLWVALGVWLIVRYGMLYGRTNVAKYNNAAADELEVEDIMRAELADAQREALLAEKERGRRLGAVCGAIMIVATIVGLWLLFAPALAAPDSSAFSPEGTSATWFWVAWPIGALLCGLVSVIWEGFARAGSRGA